MERVVFIIAAIGSVLSAVWMVFGENTVHSALALVANFFTLAVFYVLLEAHFLAIVQIIVYAGAIMVLFLFVVMLLNAPQEDAAEWDRTHPLRRPGTARFGAMLARLLSVQLIWALVRVNESSTAVGAAGDVAAISSVRSVGRVLFTDYMFAFEATSILILVAMVGAVLLAGRETGQQ